MMLKHIWYFWMLGLFPGAAVLPERPQNVALNEKIDFELRTDKRTFAPNSTIWIKYEVENVGESPIYIHRNFGPCSNPWGTVSLQILDQDDRDARKSGCSEDPERLKDNEILSEVRNSAYWVRINPGEFFGAKVSFQLPGKSGEYRLKAELIRPSFTERQKEILNRDGIRVLEASCPAPVLSININ
jgi:hypothetical protein